jgi:hypothetical protein
MEGESHELLTKKVIEWLAELDPGFTLTDSKEKIARKSRETDYLPDMEFVNVEGGLLGHGRDNPHAKEGNKIDDVPHTSARLININFTTFNHFIDIRKGNGIFDDYDGYSYKRGSACAGEYQDASAATDNMWGTFISGLLGKKVDDAVNWWFNDEYVHAPGHDWYDNCSPAVERYSFCGDKDVYADVIQEAAARFPMAKAAGEEGKGIPYSVFMPVDNLARYWYAKFQETGEPAHLGMVMHAVQDASIPHHAAGCLGNWHGRYENELIGNLNNWLIPDRFKSGAMALYHKWNHNDPTPPAHLGVKDYDKIPKKNWRIDMLVTWLALHAYHLYAHTYNHFAAGYSFDEKNSREITMRAAAMCMLVLKNASGASL